MSDDSYISEMFDANGKISQRHQGYEVRSGQIELARAIHKAITTGRHLVAEGPTGVGKSFAYLIPSARYAIKEDKRILVATANITLQEQLIKKDLPEIKSLVGNELRFCLLKGRSNYLCVAKLTNVLNKPIPQWVSKENVESKQWERVKKWAGTTSTGDISELLTPPSSIVWSEFSSTSDDCTGSKCPLYDRCFYYLARYQAAENHIIVVNYHLLCAHLSLKQQTFGKVRLLPSYTHLIGDEAHDLQDIARDFFGSQLTISNFYRLKNGLLEIGDKDNKDLADALIDEARYFFQVYLEACTKNKDYRIFFREPFLEADRLMKLLDEVDSRLSLKQESAKGTDNSAHIAMLVKIAESTTSKLHILTEQTDTGLIYWIEKSGKSFKLVAKPIDVDSELKSTLFDKTPCILVSATLAVDKDFSFFKEGIGLTSDNVDHLIASTPFDYKRQSLLVVPSGIPKANAQSADFQKAVAESSCKIIKDIHGRTLLLFTSYTMLNATHQTAQKELGDSIKILRQGQSSNVALIEMFKTGKNVVLMGTDSFWQGIDIPGEALSCLIIDKLPFPPRHDPINAALEERDSNCFMNYYLPRTVIALRQGFGRLIRTKTDIGVVVVFDARIWESAYSRVFETSLPQILASRNIQDGIDFILSEGKSIEKYLT